MASAWVDVGGLLLPLAAWLAGKIEFPVGDARAPIVDGKLSPPPYAVAYTTGDVRDPERGTRWTVLLRFVGGTPEGDPVPEQARLLGDRGARALCDQDGAGRYLNPLTLPGVRVLARESNGDGHLEPGDARPGQATPDEWVETFALSLQPA